VKARDTGMPCLTFAAEVLPAGVIRRDHGPGHDQAGQPRRITPVIHRDHEKLMITAGRRGDHPGNPP